MTGHLSRRDLIKWAGAGAGVAAIGGATYMVGRSEHPAGTGAHAPSATSDPVERRPQITAAAPQPALARTSTAIADRNERLLVVVEMDGGNDGMSMVVPYGLPGYYDLRKSTAIGEKDVLALDGEVGLHGSLPNIHRRGAAVFQGIGSNDPDGSHFEMMARWWNGSPDPSSRLATGFLGRLADAIGDPAAAAVALSISSGAHPALISERVSTLSIPGVEAIDYVVGAAADDPLRRAFQRGLARFGSRSGAPGSTGGLTWDARLRSTISQSIDFGWLLLDDDGSDDDLSDAGGQSYPDSPLGAGLQLAARLLSGGHGIRIVHVPMNQDFDTHDDHNGRYPALMQDLDASIEAFTTDLEARGLSDRVLVMTTSEFGRTARDNDSGGLDHGTASNTMLLGPVLAGRFGEHPSLTKLDDNNDLVATARFDQYYATVAEGWFGVPASEVLEGNPEPFTDVINQA